MAGITRADNDRIGRQGPRVATDGDSTWRFSNGIAVICILRKGPRTLAYGDSDGAYRPGAIADSYGVLGLSFGAIADSYGVLGLSFGVIAHGDGIV